MLSSSSSESTDWSPSCSALIALLTPAAWSFSAASRWASSSPLRTCWTRKKPSTAATATEIASVLETTRSCSEERQRWCTQRTRPRAARWAAR